MRTLRRRTLTTSGGWNHRRHVHRIEDCKFYHRDEAPARLLCSCGASFEFPTAAQVEAAYRRHQKDIRLALHCQGTDS